MIFVDSCIINLKAVCLPKINRSCVRTSIAFNSTQIKDLLHLRTSAYLQIKDTIVGAGKGGGGGLHPTPTFCHCGIKLLLHIAKVGYALVLNANA